MRTITVSNCSNCGRGILETDEVEDMWQTHCDSCNRSFEVAMRAEYPFGQCNQCGAQGFRWGPNGKYVAYAWEVGAHHSEGVCTLAGDREDFTIRLTPVVLKMGSGATRLRLLAEYRRAA